MRCGGCGAWWRFRWGVRERSVEGERFDSWLLRGARGGVCLGCFASLRRTGGKNRAEAKAWRSLRTWRWTLRLAARAVTHLALGRKCLSGPRATLSDMGSFDFVRLAPHFAQDDRREESSGGEGL